MGVSFPGKKRYEGVELNIISVMRGWVTLGVGRISRGKALRNT